MSPRLLRLLAVPFALACLLLLPRTARAAEPGAAPPLDWPPSSAPLPRPVAPPDTPIPTPTATYSPWPSAAATPTAAEAQSPACSTSNSLAGVFVSVRDGNWEVYNTEDCGQGPTRLTRTEADEARPALSADARWIVYDGDQDSNGRRELWLMRYDGSDNRLLLQADASLWAPSWSPDGTRIVYVRGAGTRADLWVVDIATGATRPLVAGPTAEFDPSWGVDGRIRFVRALDANQGQIIAIDPATGAETLAVGSALRTPRFPALSPNGTQLAFSWDANGDRWLDADWIDLEADPIVQHALPAPVSDAEGCHYLTDGWRFHYIGQTFYGPSHLTVACYGRADGRWASTQYRVHDLCGNMLCFEEVLGMQGANALLKLANRDHTPPQVSYGPVRSLVGSRSYITIFRLSDGGPYVSGTHYYQWQRRRDGRLETGVSEYYPGRDTYFFPECETVSVRVRAVDGVGNVSEWTDWITATGYAEAIAGAVVDVRGVPLPGIRVATNPSSVEPSVLTRLDGGYLLHTCQYFDMSVEATPPPGAWKGPGAGYLYRVYLNRPRTHVIHSTEGLVFADDFGDDFGPDHPGLPVGWTSPYTEVVASDGFGGASLRFISPAGDGTYTQLPKPFDRVLWARTTRMRLPTATPDHALTLSFLAETSAQFDAPYELAVNIQTSLWPTATTVYTITPDYTGTSGIRVPYVHHWTPLDLPVGDQITVTFALSVPANVTVPDVWIDNVVIGSWWSAAPRAIERGVQSLQAQETITVTGENFLAPVAVALSNGLDETPLASAVLDSNTLTATLPASLPPGLYTLLVTNQAGTPLAIQTALPNALLAGAPVWLPLVSYP